jgi:FkbM family methyltransferase
LIALDRQLVFSLEIHYGAGERHAAALWKVQPAETGAFAGNASRDRFVELDEIMNFYKDKRTYGGSNCKKNGEVDFWKWIQTRIKFRTIFDVGVEKSSHLLEHNTSFAQYYLFEPNIDHYNFIKMKYVQDFVHIHNFGLSNRDEMVTLYGGTGSCFNRVKTIPNHPQLLHDQKHIECKKLYDICTQYAIEHIDFIKIDVEGYELNVLLGAEKMLNYVDMIQFECNKTYIDANITVQQIWDLFKDEKRFYYAIEAQGLNIMNELPQNETTYTNFIISKFDLQTFC